MSYENRGSRDGGHDDGGGDGFCASSGSRCDGFFGSMSSEVSRMHGSHRLLERGKWLLRNFGSR